LPSAFLEPILWPFGGINADNEMVSRCSARHPGKGQGPYPDESSGCRIKLGMTVRAPFIASSIFWICSTPEKELNMRGIALRWLSLTVAIILASYLLSGIHVSGFLSALGAAAMLGILNAFFRPIALILTLPINILTFGLFTFIINALMLKMVSGVISGFVVQGFWTAIFGALIISVVSFALNALISEKGRVDVIDLKHRGGDRWE
jgi:putative membrane protein